MKKQSKQMDNRESINDATAEQMYLPLVSYFRHLNHN